MERSARTSSYSQYQGPNENPNATPDKEKGAAIPRDTNPSHKVNTDSSSGGPQRKPTPSKTPNPYAKPMGLKCYRCGQPGHRSNECTNRRTVGLVDGEESGKDEDYEGVEIC